MFDLVVKGGLVYRKGKIEKADIGISGGIIKEIREEIEEDSKETIYADGKLVFPAFANVHTHVSMSLLRGIGSDLPLMDWLQKVIWPLEGEFVSPEFVKTGSLLGILEMIKSGTTLFLDMYFFEDKVGEAVEEAGIRAGLGFGILDFPTKVAKTPDEYIRRCEEMINQFKGHSHLIPVVSPHATYTCSPSTLRKSLELAEKYDVPIHIHLSETRSELERVKEEYGFTPVKHLENLGFLSDRVIAAHVVWTDEEEREILKERKVNVVHCPESNLKLASGIAPIPDYIRRGIKVGIGTDGPASNDNLDILEEVSTMAKMHKGYNLDAKAIDAHTALKISTENGFSMLGIKAGNIDTGYEADIIIVNTDSPHFQPLYDPIAQFIYAGKSSDIETVICKGKVVMYKGEIKTLDEEKIIREAKKWGEKIKHFMDKNLMLE